MSGFTQPAFEKNLTELNSSQQSIQTLSMWCIYHRKHYKAIVQTWFKELKKQTKPTRRLAFMYLANDVIQNSKKKGPEFSKEFLSILKPCFQHIAKDVDSATLTALDRIIKIWDDRTIYDKAAIKGFRQALHPDEKDGEKKENSSNNSNAVKNNSNSSSSSKAASRKRENDDSKDNNGRPNKKILTEKLDSSMLNNMMSKLGESDILPPIDLSKYEKVEPEKLIKSLKDLENCASADATVRQKIANLPSEVFDAKLIDSVVNQESADRWSKMVDEAQSILSSYNSRLAKEMEDRKQLATMLAYFIEGQKRALSEAEQHLKDYRDKLRKVLSVRDELQSHLQNLPDLSQLPSVTPLPSALDLFKL